MGDFQRVTTNDLKRMCISAGLPFPEDEIDRLIVTCPKDDNGKVSFEDFIMHLERSQVEAISGNDQTVQRSQIEAQIVQEATVDNTPLSGPDAVKLQEENVHLKCTISELEQQLKQCNAPTNRGGPSKKNLCSIERFVPEKDIVPEIPTQTKTEAAEVVNRVTRSNNLSKNISKVFPDPKDALPPIQVHAGRKKFKVSNPPTEDIFGNKIESDNKGPEVPVWTTMAEDASRPAPIIDRALLENVRACMDRNNKRALKDVTTTINRWNGGSVMTKRMLTKIIKHSGLRLPNETVRLLFDKLDVHTDGTVALRDFFQVFADAENAQPRVGHDPGQISRDRRAEMQRRAAPWATF